MAEERPFLEDGSQFGVSRTAFRRMRKADKKELMLRWFFSNYEDPAEKTPYESAEGGYQWIWGGPYEARDELFSKFGNTISESLLEEVAEEIERDGLFEWAPVHTEHLRDMELPDEPPPLDIYLDEPSRGYGTPEDHQARSNARSELKRLQQALNRPRKIGIGHNHPPADEELEEIRELREAVGELLEEYNKSRPTIALVKKWATPLRNALVATSRWALRKVDGAVDAAVKVLATTAVVGLGVQYHEPLEKAFDATIRWLDIVAKRLF